MSLVDSGSWLQTITYHPFLEVKKKLKKKNVEDEEYVDMTVPLGVRGGGGNKCTPLTIAQSY